MDRFWSCLAVGLAVVFFAHTASAQTPLPSSVTVKEGAAGKKKVTFTFEPGPAAKKVCITGTFNEWNGTKDEMTKGADGKWSTTFELPDGAYEYKFVVDGTDWRYDPKNPDSVDDKYGSRNSVVRVGTGAPVAPAGLTGSVSSKPISWETDMAVAQQKAAAKKQKLLLFFVSPGGENSKMIENAILGDSRVVAAVEANYVAVKLDTTKYNELARQLGVFRSGVILLYNSDGSPIKKVERVATVDQFLKDL
ncbi:MAG: hypothetical protein K1X53_03510 [Candidatus Sumerlaeaceae bacterium]|nr:hypothetical protein [Candidatus Sumerlaeaceae bacterium]